MSKHNLTPEEAAVLPGRAFYTVRQVAWMVQVEYQGVLKAIRDGVIPAMKIGPSYRVPAWWVDQHRVGPPEPVDTDPGDDSDDLAQRRAS